MALQSLDLGQYSDVEKDLLTSLTTRIYSLYEVHYHHVGGMMGAWSGRPGNYSGKLKATR